MICTVDTLFALVLQFFIGITLELQCFQPSGIEYFFCSCINWEIARSKRTFIKRLVTLQFVYFFGDSSSDKYQEIIKVREWIPHIGHLTKEVSLKLFLDIVPSSSAETTCALRESFREGSAYMYVVSFQTKGKSPTLLGCLLWYFDYMQGSFGSRYVLIHFETLIRF